MDDINIFKPFPGLEINNVGLELGEYQASDVIAPGSVPPPTWRKESLNKDHETVKNVVLPSDEAYLASRKGMHMSGDEGSVDSQKVAGSEHFGNKEMVFFDNYRRDKLGLQILKLSRYSHLLIRFPKLKPIVDLKEFLSRQVPADRFALTKQPFRDDSGLISGLR